MAKRKTKGKKRTGQDDSATQQKFPYTNVPNDLKRLLEIIPGRPKPSKLSMNTLKTWDIKNNNASTAVKVLRELGLLDGSATPTEHYSSYMTKGTGGGALAKRIREKYSKLFELVSNPQDASTDDLKNFFNIHSAGAEKTIDLQVRTFKVLCEFAKFDDEIISGTDSLSGGNTTSKGVTLPVHFDLHIHLPEGKSASDYEAIFRAISDYIVSKLRG